jgi:hypothetical protein
MQQAPEAKEKRPCRRGRSEMSRERSLLLRLLALLKGAARFGCRLVAHALPGKSTQPGSLPDACSTVSSLHGANSLCRDGGQFLVSPDTPNSKTNGTFGCAADVAIGRDHVAIHFTVRTTASYSGSVGVVKVARDGIHEITGVES